MATHTFPESFAEFEQLWVESGFEMPEDTNTQSVIVGIDGETKVGKGFFGQLITNELHHNSDQRTLKAIKAFSQVGHPQDPTAVFEKSRYAIPLIEHLLITRGYTRFKDIVTVSAGNSFRAIAHIYNSDPENKKAFGADDLPEIERLLDTEGFIDYLQTDPIIATSVSTVAQLEGVHETASAVFTRMVERAILYNTGGNLIIADARNPDSHFRYNEALTEGRISPKIILPILLECSDEDAAARLSGDYEVNLATVRRRRAQDRERPEFPYIRPINREITHARWLNQLGPRHDGTLPPSLLIHNDFGTTPADLQRHASIVALAAQDLSIDLRDPNTDWSHNSRSQ